MKNIFKIALGLFAMFTVATANVASADAVTNSVVGVQGVPRRSLLDQSIVLNKGGF